MIVERREKEIARLLKDGGPFIVCGHVRPDADCVGSLLALYRALKKIGREAEIWMEGEIPYHCRFLPSSGEIHISPPPPQGRYDAALVLDTPKPERLGLISDTVSAARLRVNIDHHPSNERWGDYNWVDPRASATAEFIYLLIPELGADLDREMATCLYAGIITDTGRFCYSNTTAFTHRVVSDLIERGVSPAYVADHIYSRSRPQKIKLLGRVLSSLRFACGGAVAWLRISPRMYTETGAGTQDAEGFINFARDINGVRVAFLLEEQGKGGGARVSLRSRDGRIDVNRIASRFGGGGHAAAAGALIAGDPEEAEKNLLEEIERELARHRGSERVPRREKAGGNDLA